MNYEVSYKRVNGWFWKKIKKVKGDFIAQDLPTKPRVLVLEDEQRMEIPTDGIIFKFSVGRFIMIKQQMETEAGQQLPLK